MKRVWTTIAVVAIALAPLRADITITQTITIEGPMAAAMGGQEPKILLRIKGNKSRTDADVMNTTMASITDLDTKQLIVLNGTDKTAQITAIGAAAPAKPATPGSKPLDMDVTFKATGNTRKLEAGSCDDHSFSLTMDMAQFGNQAQMPPETAEMLKGVRIVANGISCIAKEGKGVAEFAAFQKAAVGSGLMSAAMGVAPGGGGGGMEKLMAAVASAPGMPYITEITMTFEGTGPMVDMMKQMGAMKIIQKTTNVSTDSISDDLFKVPPDYKVTEKK